jgi:hypothetical protein
MISKDTMEGIRQSLEFYTSKMNPLDEKKYNLLHVILPRLKEKRNQLHQELTNEKPEKTNESTTEIVLLLNTEKENLSTLEVSYMVPSCSWTSLYGKSSSPTHSRFTCRIQ